VPLVLNKGVASTFTEPYTRLRLGHKGFKKKSALETAPHKISLPPPESSTKNMVFNEWRPVFRLPKLDRLQRIYDQKTL